MKALFRALALLLGLIEVVGGLPSVGVADPYFNSGEPGCDGSNTNYLLCDDFETSGVANSPNGIWYGEHCDTANANGGIGVRTKGWCGTIFSNPITPAGAGDCSGTIGALGQCAATSGALNGSVGGRNMADHAFPSNQEVQTIYVRYYRKNSVGFLYSGQKVLTFNRCCAGGGGIFWGGLGFNIGHQSASTGAPSIGITNNLIGDCGGGGICGQNQGNDISLTSGNWYYFEARMTLNTVGNANGVFSLWANNCGATVAGCSGQSPILRANHTTINWGKTAGNGGIGVLWLENWANNGDSQGSTGTEWYDQLIISKTGPIGMVATGPTLNAPTNLQVTTP